MSLPCPSVSNCGVQIEILLRRGGVESGVLLGLLHENAPHYCADIQSFCDVIGSMSDVEQFCDSSFAGMPLYSNVLQAS